MATSTQTNPGPTSARGRISGGMTRILGALASPRDPGDYLDMLRPLRAGGDLRARVVSVRRETDSAVTVELRPGDAWQGHVPGQYVRVGVEVAGIRLWRSYSITSTPGPAPTHITITAKAVADGQVSRHLWQDLRPGQYVHLDTARGDFVLPDPPPAKVLFITGGSGITPVMGMLRAGIDQLRDVVMIHTDKTAADVIFAPELRGLAATDRLRLVEHHSDSQGFLDAEAIVDLVPDVADRQTFACGPAGLLDAVTQTWAARGIDDHLHMERFRAPLAPAGDGGTVCFTETGASVTSDGATTILDAGEQAGVLMPSGCRMGICYSCVVPLREGSVRDLRTGDVMTATDEEHPFIQTCVTAAAGTCHVEA